MEGSQRKSLAVLMPALIAFSMGQTVLFALAGPVARDIGLSEFQVGMIVASAAVVFVIASPMWGRISDRWGRKRVIVFGLTSYGAVSILFALALRSGLDGATTATTTFFLLLFLRMTYAALGGGIQPAATGFMADVSSAENRSAAIALIGASFGLGSILGPAAAAALVGFGLLAPLYVIAVYGLIMAGIAFVLLQEPPHAAASENTAEAFSFVTILPLLMVSFCLFTVFAILQQTAAFYVQDFLGADAMTAARMTGYCFMSLAIAALIMQGGVIQALKPRPEILLLTGFPIFLVGVWAYASAGAFWHIILAMGLMGTGFGLVNPGITAAVSLRTSEKTQGRAAGFVQSAASIGFIVGPLLGTGLYQISPLYTIMLAAFMLCIGLGVSGYVTVNTHPAAQSSVNVGTRE